MNPHFASLTEKQLQTDHAAYEGIEINGTLLIGVAHDNHLQDVRVQLEA